MALLHSIQRSDFEHDVVHHGKNTTPVGKAAKPQGTAGFFFCLAALVRTYGDVTTTPGLPGQTEKYSRSNIIIWG
ncbi:MAG: hypothetical protein IIC07_04870 [Proteobacteria bacterium]|nr:hypothetical protein [Pseudomonadota bacterium]MCH8173048.1 hypothetical protein [Pseudomonadota bacterium]MCH8322306.1 hypothetical protein [Pseudomonadota bacterium]